jgi:CO dehydrogenase/acetyl-CoA synthase epsilon subunit
MTSNTTTYSWKVNIQGTFTIRVGFRGNTNYDFVISNGVIITSRP